MFTTSHMRPPALESTGLYRNFPISTPPSREASSPFVTVYT